MALTDCLATALEGKEITKQQHDRLVADYQRLRAEFGPLSADAAEQAKRSLLTKLKAETVHAKRRARIDLANTRRILTDLDAFRTPAGGKDVAAAALYKLDNNGEAKFDGVSRRHDVITGMAHARMESLLSRFRRSKLVGDKIRANRAQLNNVVREAFGEDTGDVAAKGFAQAWGDTAEWLRQRFNAAGGAIAKLDKWGLPQWHDRRALVARGLDAWRDDIKAGLDSSRMLHPLTRTPILDSELDEVLNGIWHGIVTDGWDTREAARQIMGKGALANQRQEHRFLVFKNADAWMKYQADYGGGSDPFAAMMGHVNMMSRDSAAMEILGTNPPLGVEFLKQIVAKEAAAKAAGKEARFAGAGDPINRAKTFQHRIDSVWGSIRGTLNTPVNGRWANIGAGVRNIITSSVLGSAAIAAISDVGTQQVTRAFAGLPVTNVFKGTIQAAVGGATQRDAVAAGLVLDAARHVQAAQARYVGTFSGPEWTAYLGDRVLTLSGLTAWTQGGKHAFGLAFMHELAKQHGKAWEALQPLLRRKLEQYGMTADSWTTIGRAEIHAGETGLLLLRPNEIAGHDPKLAERYLGMILSETEYAVPSGTHRSRTVLIDQNQPGTLAGELLRSFSQFKSFGAVYAMLHGARIATYLTAKETRPLGAAYAGALLLTGTFFGALALELKQVAAGRDPRAINTPEFWGAALLQGGGLGIYGDFLFSDLNRYGGGIQANLAGPAAERLGDFANLTVGNVVQLASGDKTNFGRELINFARGNVPGGNIWFLRLAWEHMVLDQMQFLVDPEANKSFKAKQQRWRHDFDQGFWWRPGAALPERAPDLANLAPQSQP